MPITIIEKSERLAVTAPFPLQPFLNNSGTPFALVDSKVIGNEWQFRILAVLQLDDDRTTLSPCLKLPGAPPPIPCVPQAELEALGEKAEDIKQSGLATAVRAKQYGQRGNLFEFDALERAVIFHTQILDTCR